MGLRHIVVHGSLIGSLVAGAPLAVLAGADASERLALRPRFLGSGSTALSAPRPALVAVQAGEDPRRAPEVAVKAAFLYNFARFTEWPALPAEAPIVACIVGDAKIATALMEIVRAHTVAEHRLVLGPSEDSATWRTCHLLFISDSQREPSVGGLAALTALPVLTVSDTKGFAQAGGVIELYASAGQLRFAINVDAAERTGLRLSSRLLSLAKVIGQGGSARK